MDVREQEQLPSPPTWGDVSCAGCRRGLQGVIEESRAMTGCGGGREWGGGWGGLPKAVPVKRARAGPPRGGAEEAPRGHGDERAVKPRARRCPAGLDAALQGIRPAGGNLFVSFHLCSGL